MSVAFDAYREHRKTNQADPGDRIIVLSCLPAALPFADESHLDSGREILGRALDMMSTEIVDNDLDEAAWSNANAPALASAGIHKIDVGEAEVLDRVFGWMVRPFVHAVETFDVREPATFIHHLYARLESAERSAAPQVSEKDVVRAVVDGWAGLDGELERAARAAERVAGHDPRHEALLRLLRAADARVPRISLLVALQADPKEQFVNLCQPADLLLALEQQRGEARAKTALRAFQETCEHLYAPFLAQLWALTCFARGRPPKRAPTFGAQIDRLRPRLAVYPGLLHEDAAWMRNAAAHGHAQYLVRLDALRMWDEHVPPRVVRVRDILRMGDDMYRLVGRTWPSALALHVNRELAPALLLPLRELFPKLLDPMTRAEAERAIDAHARAYVQPVVDFANLHA